MVFFVSFRIGVPGAGVIYIPLHPHLPFPFPFHLNPCHCLECSPDFLILDHPFKLSPYTISPHHHTMIFLDFLVVYYHTVTMAMAKHSFIQFCFVS